MEENNFQNAQPVPKKKSKLPVMIISAVIAVILAAAAVIVFVDPFGLELFGKSDKEQSEKVSEPLPMRYYDKEKKLWGYINASGEYVIEPQFNVTYGFNENSDLAVVQAGKDLGFKWGYINKSGEMVIKPQFDEARDFFEGLAAVYDGTEWGYINTEGKVVINYQYTDALDFKDGSAVVCLRNNDEEWKYGIIDKEGEYIVDPVYDEIFTGGNFDRSRDLICAGVGKDYNDRKYGFIDIKTGELVIDTIYTEAYMFSEGLAPVRGDDGKWGYIDKSGEYVIRPQFDHARPFKNGAAVVSANEKYGYIDKKGQYIINPQFSSANEFDEDGFAMVREGTGDNEKEGIINKNGDYVVRPQKQFVSGYKNGMYIVGDNKTHKCGLAGPDGNMILKQEYDGIDLTDDGFIFTMKADNGMLETCYFDMNGNLIK